jgi:hypothetical protein
LSSALASLFGVAPRARAIEKELQQLVIRQRVGIGRQQPFAQALAVAGIIRLGLGDRRLGGFVGG